MLVKDEELRDKQGKRALEHAAAGSKALHLLSAHHDQLLLERLEAP